MDLSVTRTGDTPDRALAQVERDLARACRTAATDVGKAARRQILADVKAARGSLRFMGGRLGIRQTVDADATGATVTLHPVPAGAWSILESGTKPYTIRPRRARVLARGRGRGDVFGVKVDRKRTVGRSTWSRAVDRLAGLEDAVTAPFDAALEQG